MKRIKTSGLCLLSLCLATVFGMGAVGASAAPLLFIPHSGTYPYHFVGSGGESLLETVGGNQITAEATDVLGVVLGPTLFNLKIEFLNVNAGIGGACSNEGKSGNVLVNLLGHFGFADPGNVPAVLLLVPSGFTFTCAGGFATIHVRGSVIGSIAAPGLGVSTELMRVAFKITPKGKQQFTTFLLNNETLTNQFEETEITGLGAKKFEQSGQEGEAHLLALPGQGTFLLVSP
jgi:hypothetical protein